MRLGRKLSEGFAVDREADDAAAVQPAPVADRAVPVAVEHEHVVGGVTGWTGAADPDRAGSHSAG